MRTTNVSTVKNFSLRSRKDNEFVINVALKAEVELNSENLGMLEYPSKACSSAQNKL